MRSVNLRLRKLQDQELNFSHWKSDRIFLMYPLNSSMPHFLYNDSIYPVFRGLFIDIKDNQVINATPIMEDVIHMFDGKFPSIEEKEKYLEDFYYLTWLLNDKDAYLVSRGKILEYRWKYENEKYHEDPLELPRKKFRELLTKKSLKIHGS